MPRVLVLALAATAVASAGRLRVDGRGLVLDGRKWIQRGVTYAPTPIGQDPTAWSAGEPLLSAEYADMHERDVNLLADMGANNVRLYQLTGDSSAFLQRAHEANLTAMGGFGLYVDTANPASMFLPTASVLQGLKDELRAALRQHNHTALTFWSVGNELNGVWNNWVGDADDCPNCLMGDDVQLLYGPINDLCGIVHEFGLLWRKFQVLHPLRA